MRSRDVGGLLRGRATRNTGALSLHMLVEEGDDFFRMPSEAIVTVLEAPGRILPLDRVTGDVPFPHSLKPIQGRPFGENLHRGLHSCPCRGRKSPEIQEVTISRKALKIRHPQGCVGSTPTPGTCDFSALGIGRGGGVNCVPQPQAQTRVGCAACSGITPPSPSPGSRDRRARARVRRG